MNDAPKIANLSGIPRWVFQSNHSLPPHCWQGGAWKPIHKDIAWYHGGPKGLEPGDVLVSQIKSGVQGWTRSPKNPQAELVFITPHKGSAMSYAIGFEGALYRVEPEGKVLPDKYDPTFCFSCDRARIVAVERETIELDAWIAAEIELREDVYGCFGPRVNRTQLAHDMHMLRELWLDRAKNPTAYKV